MRDPDPRPEREHSTSVFQLDMGDGRISVGGELDASTSAIVTAAIQATGGTDVLVDLRSVGFVDSSGLRVLASEHHRLGAAGGVLRVVASPTVFRTIELAGLTDVLSVTEA